MSPGLGIFLSTLALIVAWQVERRGKWRTVGRAFVVCFTLTCFVTGALYGYQLLSERRDQKRRAQIAAKETDNIRGVIGLTYWGLSLRMPKGEVRYLKGDPDNVQEPQVTQADSTTERWTYHVGPGEPTVDYDVFWDRTGQQIDSVVCYGERSEDCPRFLGVGPGSSEAAVRAAFGVPVAETMNAEKGTKTLTYGTTRDHLLFLMSRGQVDLVVLDQNNSRRIERTD